MNEFVSKEIRINVRTRDDIKRDLEIVAHLRGVKVSSLVNQLLMQAIREEKEREPAAFHRVTPVKQSQKKQTIPLLKEKAK